MKGDLPMAKSKDLEVDDICSLIIDGKTFREIADMRDIKLSTLHDWMSRPEHSARVKAAMEISADSYSDMAEKVLREAKSTMTEVQRARELAQHFRWKAAKRLPKKYGDKVEVESNVNVKDLPDWLTKKVQ